MENASWHGEQIVATEIVRTIKRMLYEHFVEIGYCVYYEMKLLPHHYTHLVVVMNQIIKSW